jgi:hypothetical protein
MVNKNWTVSKSTFTDKLSGAQAKRPGQHCVI